MLPHPRVCTPSYHTHVHTCSPSPSVPRHPHVTAAPAGLWKVVLRGERVAGAVVLSVMLMAVLTVMLAVVLAMAAERPTRSPQ